MKKNLTSAEAGTFEKIKSRLSELESDYSARNTMDDEIEQMFLMDWSKDKPDDSTQKHIKLTISPDARNKALGAIRLMTATDPKFTIPREKNDKETEKQSDLLEKAASAIWHMNGMVKQNQVHYDMVTSAVLFAEFHTGVTMTEDLVEYAKGAGKAAEKRIERLADMVPVLFDTYDPRTGYPEYDEFGLSAFYRKVEMKSGTVVDKWGERAKSAGISDTNRAELVNICEYWDNIFHVVWIEGGEQLLFAEHGLPCIPIVAQITDGSSIHEKEEYKRQPFLYTLWKSQLHLRQNLMLTIENTNLFTLASNPTFVFTATAEDRTLRPDYSTIGGHFKILNGESFTPLAKNAIDPAMTQMLAQSKELINESTIYGQTLGEPLGGNAPYSMVALLNQAGRLPLVTLQRRGSWGIGKAMEIAFLLMQDRGGTRKIKDGGSIVEISGKDIPDNLIIEATLDIDLPQDQRQAIQMFTAITAGDHPGLDMETARRTILKEEQSDEIDKKIMAERYAWLEFEKDYQMELARSQMQLQQQMQGQQVNSQQNQIPANQQTQQMDQRQAMQQQMMMDQMARQQGASNGLPMTEPIDEEAL